MIKLLLFFILYAVLISVFKLFLKDKFTKKSQNVLSIVISIISIRFISEGVIYYIAASYTTIGSMFLLLVPIIALHVLLYNHFPTIEYEETTDSATGKKTRAKLTKEKKNKAGEVVGTEFIYNVPNIVIHIVVWVMTISLFAFMTQSSWKLLSNIAAWGIIIGIFALIFDLFKLIDSSADDLENGTTGSKLWDWAAGNKKIKTNNNNLRNTNNNINELHKRITNTHQRIDNIIDEFKNNQVDHNKLKSIIEKLKTSQQEHKNIKMEIERLKEALRGMSD